MFIKQKRECERERVELLLLRVSFAKAHASKTFYQRSVSHARESARERIARSFSRFARVRSFVPSGFSAWLSISNNIERQLGKIFQSIAARCSRLTCVRERVCFLRSGKSLRSVLRRREKPRFSRSWDSRVCICVATYCSESFSHLISIRSKVRKYSLNFVRVYWKIYCED